MRGTRDRSEIGVDVDLDEYSAERVGGILLLRVVRLRASFCLEFVQTGTLENVGRLILARRSCSGRQRVKLSLQGHAGCPDCRADADRRRRPAMFFRDRHLCVAELEADPL